MGKKKKIFSAVVGALLAWHLILAWGAYHRSNVLPEDTAAVRSCLRSYSLQDLTDDSPADKNVELAINVARQGGYGDESGRVNWQVIQYILVNQFDYSQGQALAALERLQKYSESEFRECRGEYRAASREYEVKEALLREGLGWVESPKPIFLWSRLTIGKWEDVF